MSGGKCRKRKGNGARNLFSIALVNALNRRSQARKKASSKEAIVKKKRDAELSLKAEMPKDFGEGSEDEPRTQNRATQWAGFWFSMSLAFYGIHLMKESTYF